MQLAGVIAAAALATVACGGDGGDAAAADDTARLRTALAFLATDQGLGAAQVSCVAGRVDRSLTGDERDAFIIEATRVGESGELESMAPSRQDILTDAIAACAAAG